MTGTGRIKKRIYDYLYDSSIDPKERAFVVFSVSELAALFLTLVIGIFLKEPKSSTMVQFLITAACTALFIFAVKTGKLKGARIVVAFLLVFLLQPAMFFTKGGIHAGATLSILLGSYYLVLVLDGKFRLFMCFADLAVLGACWIAAYMNPELVTGYPIETDYIYTIAKYIITWLVLTVIITYQTRIYSREAKKSEEKTKELEELNKAQNRFFSSMSHEIRTPINTVLGLNEIILRQEDASDEIKRDARNIQGAGKMLLALINDILDISKIEAGKMDIVPVNYNVSSLLSEIVNMIWLKAEEKGLKFNVNIDPNVPEMLFGDEVRIKQVLINLLNNAVKYTKEGSVNLHMECEFQESGEVLLKISISDTGMGIKPDALPHLFDTFQRVDEEKNRYIEGTGLGLSIVKQLVELMDGEITVNSVYGEGSVFAVTLRQGVSSGKRIGDIKVTGNGNVGDEGKYMHSFRAPNARILIVDDNEMNLQVEKKLLDGMEMTVDLALSGAEALMKTLQNRYDVIFMDHLMPEMDGIECFNKISTQKGGLNTGVPVIILTANAGGENIELYNNTGFDGCLVKPVSGRQLENMLLEHLSPEKVIRSGDNEMTGASMNTSSGYTRKKPVVIATSTMCDLPANVIRDLDISIIPYTVTTDDGVFYDSIDIDSEELVRYMGEELRFATSDPPTEEGLVAFFASELQKAHHIIYITLTTGSSREYGRAIKAAKSFENVTVINSEFMSSATGILVLIAARLTQQNVPVERIVSELEEAKKMIRCSFVVKNTDVMARRERISPFVNSVLNALWLRPMLRVKNDKLGVGRFLFGDDRRCYEKYIEYALPSNSYPDTSFIFVTYAGLEEEELLWIEKKLGERLKFDNVIFQKASAGITSNCGGGTFGLLYMMKGNRNYNLAAYLADKDDYWDNDDRAGEAVTVSREDAEAEVTPEDAGAADTDDMSKDAEWYETIPGIDAGAGIKNSGSGEAFLSVLKIFYDTYKAKSREIGDHYENGDWENYTIKVHALKSGSRLVGALGLGDKAEALENAGKGSDIEYIAAHHEEMMNEYRAIRDALEAGFGVKEDRPDVPPEVLDDAYAGLAEFADAMDYELAKMVFDSVDEYRLPGDDAERFERLKMCLSRMDWDGIKGIIKEAGHQAV
ncbi:MAG: DegV family EDD domain-containing protein [Lachnospiraceae bacterium]|nr:DegV family EDD domain-containing protein [Lachnospiraceae bacterium]